MTTPDPDQTPEPDVDPTPDPNTPDQPEPDVDDAGGNSEAAKYRRRLRDTEVQRDTLASRVETYQRREVEALAQDKLAIPGDVFTIAGLSLTDAYGEDGELNVDVVQAAIDELLLHRPGLAVPANRREWGQGGARPPIASDGPSWSDVLNPKG